MPEFQLNKFIWVSVPGERTFRRFTRNVLRLAIILFAIGFLFFITVKYYPYHVPDAWKDIHCGMQRSELHKILGEPNVPGYDIKKMESWNSCSGFATCYLAVWYRSESEPEKITTLSISSHTPFGDRSIRREDQ